MVAVDVELVCREVDVGICSCGVGRFGAGEPVIERPVGTILLGSGLSRRTGMLMNNSDPRPVRLPVRLDDVFEIGSAFEERREG